MNATLHQVNFEGTLLARGFWLYIWEIGTGDGLTVHYVGKIGDKASGVCQSPFDRLSKHLGYNKQNNALRRYLGTKGIDPNRCHFRFHAHGPLFADDPASSHGNLCDEMSGLEKVLADAMVAAGYTVLNPVYCRQAVD